MASSHAAVAAICGLARKFSHCFFCLGLAFAGVNIAASELYARVGIGLDSPVSAAFMDRDCSSTSPAALYGCGLANDGFPRRSIGEFGRTLSFAASLGIELTEDVRLELEFDHNAAREFAGEANFLATGRQQDVDTEYSSTTAMLSAYADVRTFLQASKRPFKIFGGFGFGLIRLELEDTLMSFPRTSTEVPGADRTNATWMLTMGLSTQVAKQTTLECAWRYTDMGEIRTGEAQGRVVWRDGRRTPLILNLAETSADLRSRELRISIRHSF